MVFGMKLKTRKNRENWLTDRGYCPRAEVSECFVLASSDIWGVCGHASASYS